MLRPAVRSRWARRHRLTISLPPAHLALEPGMVVDLPMSPARWIVQRCTAERFAVAVELSPAWAPSVSLVGESGRIVQGAAVAMGPLTLALFDVPDALAPASQPTLLLAASSPTPGWRSRDIEISGGFEQALVQIATRKTILGESLSVLGTGDAFLIDRMASVDIELVDSGQWLTSCDDAALLGGANLAILGDELIQFGDAAPLSAGGFRLSRLLRGRGATEWASGYPSADCARRSRAKRPWAI